MKILEYFADRDTGKQWKTGPYLIAEAGVNHECNLGVARKMIVQAAQAGAHAIKFQTYKAGTLASINSPAYWDLEKEGTRSQYQLFKKYDKFWKKEFEKLKHWCDEENIEFLSTPFDLESAKFLNDLMEVFKISSSDITNKPFIQYLGSLGKPVILSTGASDVEEIREAVSWLEEKRVPVALLHCVLNYPTRNKDANLLMISGLKKEFPEHIIGYSDHTEPGDMDTLLTATLLGATIIEKHFTHDKTLPGNDHYHAMDQNDLFRFWERIEEVRPLLGSEHKHSLTSEASARLNARRSLVARQAIPVNSQINESQLTWKRPGDGISPKDIDHVVGRRTATAINADDLIFWDMLEK